MGRKLWRVSLRLAGGLVGILFIAAGLMKIVGAPPALEQFARAGYPDWLRLILGVVEMGGGMVLLLPRFASLGAGVLGLSLAGAVVTDLASGNREQAVLPFVLLIPVGIIGLARLQDALDFLRLKAALNAFAERELAAGQRVARPAR